jgi:hypothetical protein
MPIAGRVQPGDLKDDGAVSAHPARLAKADRCVPCHVSFPVGPPIPFDDPVALSDQLGSKVSSHGSLLREVLFRLSPQAGNHRMPLNAALSAEEELALRQYFLSLGSHD